MLGRHQRKTAREDCQALEQTPLAVIEEAVRPLQRCLHRPVPTSGALMISEQSEMFTQPQGDFDNRHGAAPTCRELEGQRQTVETFADLAHCLCRTRIVSAAGLVDPFHQQLERRRTLAVVPQRVNHGDMLTHDPQPLPAGRQHRHRWTAFSEHADQGPSAGQHVFTVVEDQEQRPTVEGGHESVHEGDRSLATDAERHRDRLVDVVWPETADRSTHTTPSANACSTPLPMANARRVLPTPPAPVRVTTRWARRGERHSRRPRHDRSAE